MSREPLFTSEADLVAAFCETIAPAKFVQNRCPAPNWVQYHETAEWDLLLAHPSGVQIGIEAKLSLNAKVLDQALPGRWSNEAGPDYRAVLVPRGGAQLHLEKIAMHLGLVVLEVYNINGGSGAPWWGATPTLPNPDSGWHFEEWPNWCPAERCKLPDYIPDVTGGHASPLKLSEWKIKAIKLLILLERRGAVTRRDMKALDLSPSRWTDHYHGFLSPGPEGYVRNGRTPDLKAQHPTNWAQIEADFDAWAKGLETAGKLGFAA